MGVFDDFGRLWDASKQNTRPGFAEGIKQAADAAEAANRMRAAGAPQGVNGVSFNPFENAGAMAAMTRGSGTVVELKDTGERFDTATIYDVTFDVAADGHPGFRVVHRQLIAAAALGNWQPGAVLPLRFDPKDTSQVVIG